MYILYRRCRRETSTCGVMRQCSIYMTISLSFQFAVFSNIQCKLSGVYSKFRDFKANFEFTSTS